MTSPARSTRTLEDRARFGLGSDTQDDETDPSTDETPLTAEGVVELAAIDVDAANIVVDSTDLTGTATNLQDVLEELDATADAAAVAATVATENAVNASYRPLFSHLTADSAARNATTTLLASGLTVTVAAGTYELDALVMYITAAAADISFKWGGTATVTATVGTSDIVAFPGALAGGDGSTPGLGVLLPTSWTTESETPFANTGAHTATPVYFKGVLVVTVAGTIILEFTQGTSDASDTKIKAGSWLKLQKVA